MTMAMRTVATAVPVPVSRRLRVGVHLDCSRVLGSGSRLVGADMGPESVLIGHVIDVSVDAVGILVTVGALHLPGTGALLVPVLGVTPAVVHVVPEAVRLEGTVVVVPVPVAVALVVVAGEAKLNGDGEEGAEENKAGHLLGLLFSIGEFRKEKVSNE